jgi:Tol biopolymer transport system component
MQVFYTLWDEVDSYDKHKYGASNPKWSPDGNKILFSYSAKDLLRDSILINESYSKLEDGKTRV